MMVFHHIEFGSSSGFNHRTTSAVIDIVYTVSVDCASEFNYNQYILIYDLSLMKHTVLHSIIV